jgi:hypothetical protein
LHISLELTGDAAEFFNLGAEQNERVMQGLMKVRGKNKSVQGLVNVRSPSQGLVYRSRRHLEPGAGSRGDLRALPTVVETHADET